ncbi:MAG: hypothetical protein AAGJ18_30015 [Bacteroidota bacterium]
MKEVEAYKIAWNTASDEGIITLHTLPDGIEQLQVDSASEGLLVLDILRHEKPVYVQGGVLLTGFEPVGEGDVDGDFVASQSA